MGRTNSTYRNHLDSFIQRFEPFKKAVRRENRKYVDSLWEKAHCYAHAGAYMNGSNPGLVAVVSVLVGLQKELDSNRSEIREIKERLEELE